MGAIQQTLVDTDSEDGRLLLQSETPPEDVINALEADLVGCVAVGHQRASRRDVLVTQSSQGTPRSIQDRESQPCGSGRLSTRMENDVNDEGNFRACTW